MLDTCFVLQQRFVLSSFAIISLGKREFGTLVCSEFRVACVFYLPGRVMGWFVVCGCGISWSYALTFWFSCCITGKYVCETDIRFNDEQEHRSI